MSEDQKLDAALMLTWGDLLTVRNMLGKVPFEHADPIFDMLLGAASLQRTSGLQDLI